MGLPCKPPAQRNGSSRQWRSDEDALLKWASALQRMPSPITTAVVAMVCTAGVLLLLHPGVRSQANETAKAVFGGSSSSSPQGNSGAYMRPSNDKNGYCRLEYTVKTWDGKNALVCDPSLCVGREKLKTLTTAGNTRRWTAFHESAYMKLFNANKIMGWLKVRVRE